MRFKWQIAAGIIIVAGLAAWLLRIGGVPGMLLIFFAIVMVPGFLAASLLSPNHFDYLEIYAISFAVGASLFNLLGILLFIIKSRVDAAFWIMLVLGVFLLLMNLRVKRGDERRDDVADNRQLKWSFLITVVVITIIAVVLGSFRGWGEDWDYYSYITMVRRLAERGLADTYPLAYAGESHDPIHSYNAWALLWAVISRGAGIDPITLYLRSTMLTVPAALLAIYSLCKSLFGKNAGYVAGILYASYHLFGMGMILLGQSSFFNDDPAWLIFFPVALALGWSYIEGGGNGQLALAVIVSAGAFITHPLWGGMIVPAFGLMLLVSLRSKGKIPRLYNAVALSGAAIFMAPLIFSIFMLATGLSVKTAWPGLTVGLIMFILLPTLLITPWVFERTRSAWKDGYVRRAWAIIGLSVVALVPFYILRFMEASIRRPEIGFETSPYKIFITNNLFVLSPWNFSYTAPDMTLYPYCLIGVLALPWLVWRYAKGDRAAGLTAVGILLVPIMANQPYLAYLFAKAAHVAYLRRVLRFGAIFASCAAGALVAAGILKRPRYAAISVIAAAAVVGIIAVVYPYSPPYFQGAFAKSLFIMGRAPSQGLFWSPDYDVYKKLNGKWDTELFATLLAQVPAGETVFSDRFTSYRLTAYRDVYVECREKPSTGAVDQVVREADQAKFFDPVTDNAGRCLILQKYKAHWALLNLDEDYKLREYYMGDPWTAEKLENDPRLFTLVGKSGDWVLFKTTGACW